MTTNQHEQPFDFQQMPGAPKIEWTRSSIDFVELAWKYKVWLAVGLVCGVVLGHMAYKHAGPEYEATEKILVSKRFTVPLRDEGRPDNTSGERGTHIAIIMSPLIVQKAVEHSNLAALPSLRGSNDPVEDVLDCVKVQRSAGDDRSVDNVFDIVVKNGNRKDAIAIADAIVDAYRMYLQDLHERNVAQISADIAAATDELQRKIDQKRADYMQFRASAPISLKAPVRGKNGERISVATNIHQENLEALDKERQLILVKKAETQATLQAIDMAMSTGTSREELVASIRIFAAPQSSGAGSKKDPNNALRGGGTGSLDSQFLSLILEEQRLLLEFGEDWPEVVTARTLIATIQNIYRRQGLPIPGEAVRAGVPNASQNANARGPRSGEFRTASGLDIVDIYLVSLRQQLAGFHLREQAIDRLYERESDKARNLSVFLEQDRQHNDAIDRLDGLWRAYQAEDSKLALIMKEPGYTLDVIAPARGQLSLKKIIKMYGAGIVVVLGLICGLIFLIEWQDTTLKSVEEIRNSLPLPILGTVPLFRADGLQKHGSPLQSALCYYHRPGSPEAEAYRSVRTAFFVCVNDQQKIIQVTSPEPGDGKSTLLANLAVAVAQSGKHVLLIDADLRRPALHNLFGLQQDRGVTDVMSGDMDLLTAAQETVVGGLSVLTSGPLPPNPAELLASPSFERLLQDAQQEFDIVLVDTPPLLAVSDPCIVAQRTHALILVLRMSRNRRTAVKRAAELLQTNNVPVIGIVCNGTDASTGGYDYRSVYTSDAPVEVKPVEQKAEELVPV
jgi:capsular exopolysaccharide synthesis family protein